MKDKTTACCILTSSGFNLSQVDFTYPYIFPRVLAATTLNLSGRISILAAPGSDQRAVFARSRSSAQPSPLLPPPRGSPLDDYIFKIKLDFSWSPESQRHSFLFGHVCSQRQWLSSFNWLQLPFYKIDQANIVSPTLPESLTSRWTSWYTLVSWRSHTVLESNFRQDSWQNRVSGRGPETRLPLPAR